MNGWMFFSSNGNDSYSRLELDALLEILGPPGHLSKEEWHTYIPESREPLQGKTLGFFCGGAIPGALKNSPGTEMLPDFPLRLFVSDFMIMPVCWTFKGALTVRSAPAREYRTRLVMQHPRVLTVCGTVANRPQYLRVYGSYSFFPPPYVLAGKVPPQNL